MLPIIFSAAIGLFYVHSVTVRRVAKQSHAPQVVGALLQAVLTAIAVTVYVAQHG